MAAFNKFRQFVEDIGIVLHNLDTDELKVLLTNTVPNVADTHVDTDTATCTVESTSNAAEIAAGNGYTKGGTVTANNVYSETTGVGKLVSDDVVFTASGGTIGPFRYVVLYNNTKGTSATRPVIGWWDYGSAVTLQISETFTVDFDASAGILTIT